MSFNKYKWILEEVNGMGKTVYKYEDKNSTAHMKSAMKNFKKVKRNTEGFRKRKTRDYAGSLYSQLVEEKEHVEL